jgi:hypothetical protein
MLITTASHYLLEGLLLKMDLSKILFDPSSLSQGSGEGGNIPPNHGGSQSILPVNNDNNQSSNDSGSSSANAEVDKSNNDELSIIHDKLKKGHEKEYGQCNFNQAGLTKEEINQLSQYLEKNFPENSTTKSILNKTKPSHFVISSKLINLLEQGLKKD